MSAGQHETDRALGGVERVRGVRERDSRVGLQAALSAHAADVAAFEAGRMLMELHPEFTNGSVRDFHADRAAVTAMAQRLEDRRHRVETSLAAAEEAGQRWQNDRTRLRAVEMLLERRAAARRAERERREAAELDDLGAQAWLRRRSSRPTSRGDRG